MNNVVLLLVLFGVWAVVWVFTLKKRGSLNKWLAHLVGSALGLLFGLAALVPFLPPSAQEMAEKRPAAVVESSVEPQKAAPVGQTAQADVPVPVPGLNRSGYEKRMARFLRDFPQCSTVAVGKASVLNEKAAYYRGTGSREFEVTMTLKDDKVLEVRAVSSGDYHDQAAMQDILCLTYATMRSVSPDETTQDDSFALSSALLKDARHAPARADFGDSRMVVQWLPLQVTLAGKAMQ